MHWSSQYVGLPFKDKGRDISGVDCWGLLTLAFASRGVRVPDYAGEYTGAQERAEVSALLTRASSALPWMQVAEPEEWAVVMFRTGSARSHVGIVTGRGRMLHISKNTTSRIESFETGLWTPRLVGFYRYCQ